jgi:hypothetical protein
MMLRGRPSLWPAPGEPVRKFKGAFTPVILSLTHRTEDGRIPRFLQELASRDLPLWVPGCRHRYVPLGPFLHGLHGE